MPPIEYTIEEQGKPKVNGAWLIDKTERTAMVVIDMGSKYCEAPAFLSTQISDNIVEYCPGVIIEAPAHALYLHDSPEYDYTIISFPSLVGYSAVCASTGRYDIHVGLVNHEIVNKDDDDGT